MYGNFDSCVAFNHPYKGGGLSGIYAAARQVDALAMLTVVVLPELVALAKHIDDEAFRRARQQLKARLLMNLESRLVLWEDVMRQTLAANRCTSTEVRVCIYRLFAGFHFFCQRFRPSRKWWRASRR